MAYLQEFQIQLQNRDLNRIVQLWQEYCANDHLDVEEAQEILHLMKDSDFRTPFGKYVEDIIPLCSTIADREELYQTLKLVLDLQTTNHPALADLAFQILEDRYGDQEYFGDKIRLVGLRNRDHFQGAISRYELLSHIGKGKFVYHTAGWGTGEIMDYSLVREELLIEFENVGGKKDLSFENAFNTLEPLSDDHFLSRRFRDPDLFEREAKASPLEVVHLLLNDLGPKTAAEIKDELCELVIPEPDWSKWWQGTRAKLRKDAMIECPRTTREPFRLREGVTTHAERAHLALQEATTPKQIVRITYNFVRDLPDLLKDDKARALLLEKLIELEADESLDDSLKVQVALLLSNAFSIKDAKETVVKILEHESSEAIFQTINPIDVVALKKRAIVLVRACREDWRDLYLQFLFSSSQNPIRDHVMKEMMSDEEAKELLTNRLQTLKEDPVQAPEMLIWFFQKLVAGDNVPFSNKEGVCEFFETFLILFNQLENISDYRDLCKKMYNLMVNKRFQMVRDILDGTTLEFAREFLLLVSKIHSLSDHDTKILHSLAAVVHPSIKDASGASDASSHESQVIWTTDEGYHKIQDRIKEIGTVEIVENAKEIEEARSHGDLRENAEFKFALERRARLQSELKVLSDQFQRARVITPDDISLNEVGIGNIVEVQGSDSNGVSYTILGPWDADPDKNILSFQSKFVQAMKGCKLDETFDFKGETFKVCGIRGYYD